MKALNVVRSRCSSSWDAFWHAHTVRAWQVRQRRTEYCMYFSRKEWILWHTHWGLPPSLARSRMLPSILWDQRWVKSSSNPKYFE
jgi:hypothetical protein